MNTYHFSIVLSGIHASSIDDVENKLYEAGCDDALFCSHNNDTAYLEFDREAKSAAQAIRSAIANIGRAGFTVRSIQEGGYTTAPDDYLEISE